MKFLPMTYYVLLVRSGAVAAAPFRNGGAAGKGKKSGMNAGGTRTLEDCIAQAQDEEDTVNPTHDNLFNPMQRKLECQQILIEHQMHQSSSKCSSKSAKKGSSSGTDCSTPMPSSSVQPSVASSDKPSMHPSDEPSDEPSKQPSKEPSDVPTTQPTPYPTVSTSPSNSPTETCSGQRITIAVKYDLKPEETRWFLDRAAGDGWSPVEEHYALVGDTTYSESFCLEEGTYMFAMYDDYSVRDGICCDHGEGSFKVTIEGALLAERGEFGWRDETIFSIPFGSDTD